MWLFPTPHASWLLSTSSLSPSREDKWLFWLVSLGERAECSGFGNPSVSFRDLLPEVPLFPVAGCVRLLDAEGRIRKPSVAPLVTVPNSALSIIQLVFWAPPAGLSQSYILAGEERGVTCWAWLCKSLSAVLFFTRWPGVQCFSVWRTDQCWAINILNTTSVLPSWLEAGGGGKKAQEYFECWEVHEFNYTFLHQKVNTF